MPDRWTERRLCGCGSVGLPLCEMVFGRSSLALVAHHRCDHDSECAFCGCNHPCRDRPPDRASLPSSGWQDRYCACAQSAPDGTAPGGSLVDGLAFRCHPPFRAFSISGREQLQAQARWFRSGFSFAAKHRGSHSARPVAIGLSAVKLIVQPAITAICAYGLFRLPAVPAADGGASGRTPDRAPVPSSIAEFYKREAVVTSATILIDHGGLSTFGNGLHGLAWALH